MKQLENKLRSARQEVLRVRQLWKDCAAYALKCDASFQKYAAGKLSTQAEEHFLSYLNTFHPEGLFSSGAFCKVQGESLAARLAHERKKLLPDGTLSGASGRWVKLYHYFGVRKEGQSSSWQSQLGRRAGITSRKEAPTYNLPR